MVRETALAAIAALLVASNSSAEETLAACRPNYLALVPITSSTISFPDAGVEQTVEVGQPALFTSRGEVYPRAVRLEEPVTYVGSGETAGFTVHIPAGRMGVATNTSAVSLYPSDAATVSSTRTGKPVKAVAGIAIRNVEGAPPRVYWTKGLSSWADNVPDAKVTQTNCLNVTSSGFRRELVYAGASKDAVLLTYREFNNDLARPAFTQSLTYDRTSGDEIGFRGARLRIIKATNTELTFVVLRPIASAD